MEAWIDEAGAVLTLAAEEDHHRFHAIWLRDNAPDDQTRAANGQRLIALRDIPAETRIEAAALDGDRLTLTFAPEGRQIDYSANWLLHHAYDRKVPAQQDEVTDSDVLFSDLDEASEAYEKGLRAGDLITEAGQQKVRSLSDLDSRIEDAREAGRKSLLLLVRRGGEPRFVALGLE